MLEKAMILALFFSLIGTQSFAQASQESHLLMKNAEFVTYLSNMPTHQANGNIDTLILIVHGSDYNAETYYDTMEIETNALNVQTSTLIIAPHFKPTDDTTLEANELNWTDEGWLRGDPAVNDADVSSFAVIDEMVKLALNTQNFPNVKKVIITGHSAGGQLTQRYALGSRLEDQYPWIHFRYVPANPGSYTYLNADRPVLTTQIPSVAFGIPDNASTCDYNSYKYGLQNLNAYLSQVPVDFMTLEYLTRDVIYVLGESDTDPGDGLDQDCPAVVQGPYRFARGLNFKAYLDQEFPYHTHRMLTVPGVSHTERGIYTSPNGISAVFN